MPEAEKIPAMRPDKEKRRSSGKLRFFLFSFFVILLGVLFFQSSLSKIERVEIKGNEMIHLEKTREASQLIIGDHFFGTASSTIEKRIESLDGIEKAQVRKKFPGLIVIEVQEFSRVAFQLTADGKKEAVLANGYTLPISGQDFVVDKPILNNWSPDDPWRAKLCQVLSGIPSEQLAVISEIKPSPSVSYPDKIKIYMRSPFEVYTTVTKLADKLAILDKLVYEMKEKNIHTGVFELLEVDVHKPYELYYESDGTVKSLDSIAESQKKANEPENMNNKQNTTKPTPSPTSKPVPKPEQRSTSRNS